MTLYIISSVSAECTFEVYRYASASGIWPVGPGVGDGAVVDRLDHKWQSMMDAVWYRTKYEGNRLKQ